MGPPQIAQIYADSKLCSAGVVNHGTQDPAKIAEYKTEGKELPSLYSSKVASVPDPTIRMGTIGMTTAVLELMKK